MSTSIFRLKNRNQRQFVQLDKASLWDKNLSLRAVGLWGRLMSRPDDWNFHVSELAKSNGVSVKNIYKIIKELIVAGYAKREKILDPETKRIIRWEFEVFEVPQKMDSPETKSHMPKSDQVDNHRVASGHITNIEGTDKEKTLSLVGTDVPTLESPPLEMKSEEKKPFSIYAWDTTNRLWSLIQKNFPKYKPPKLNDWAKEIDLINRRDKRSWEDIEKVIEYAFEDAFWVKVIQAPASLRRNFDRIMAKMTPVDNSGERTETNREIAQKIKNVLSQSNEHQKLTIYKNSVMNENTRDSISLDLPSEAFEEILIKWFQLRVKNG